MLQANSLLMICWWAGYTVLGIWAQWFVPGVDFFASGIVLSLQEQPTYRTLGLAILWILLQEGMGNLPFGYGVAWYGLLLILFIVGRWLFEARSFLFICLLGMGLGVLHPLLVYGLGSLANMTMPMQSAIMEGMMQAVVLPLVWLPASRLFPRKMRQDVRPL